MAKRFMMVLALMVLAGLSSAFAQNPPALPDKVVDQMNETCPMTGEKAQANVTTMVEGKVYHFCCPNCIPNFRKDPQAAAAKIKDAKPVDLMIANKEGKCPGCSMVGNPDHSLVREGKITFYCSPSCQAKDAAAAPAAMPAPDAPASGPAPVAPAPASDASSQAMPSGDACGGDCSACGSCPEGQ